MQVFEVPIPQALLIGAVLLILSVVVSKVSDRFGVPALLLFLALGMLAGSDGPGGIPFEDYALSQAVGTVALIFILFSGGMDTRWESVRPVLWHGIALSTFGVLITAVITALFAQALLGLTLAQGLLLGAIVSSTDAAAVLSVLRSRGVNLVRQLKPVLELESGSNDPMAVFLTLAAIQWLMQPATSAADLAIRFVMQMSLGAAIGAALGLAAGALINRLRLGYDGLYPALTVALVLLTYGLSEVAGGNGFLAAYLAGIVLGNRSFLHKRSLLHFHDGLAWLMQITMFLLLGLLVFPSRLVSVAGAGLLFTACLVLIARPVSVFLSLLPSRFTPREKLFLSWVGLRGAVPIILATYPLLANVPGASVIFDMVFFVVLVSVLLQGTSISQVARLLGVAQRPAPRTPALLPQTDACLGNNLRELRLSEHSPAGGKAIVDLGLPEGLLVVLVGRGEEWLVPSGATVLQPGDNLLVLADEELLRDVAPQLEGRTNGPQAA
jgi:potassium/hydrogen antiporter